MKPCSYMPLRLCYMTVKLFSWNCFVKRYETGFANFNGNLVVYMKLFRVCIARETVSWKVEMLFTFSWNSIPKKFRQTCMLHAVKLVPYRFTEQFHENVSSCITEALVFNLDPGVFWQFCQIRDLLEPRKIILIKPWIPWSSSCATLNCACIYGYFLSCISSPVGVNDFKGRSYMIIAWSSTLCYIYTLFTP